MLRLLKSLLIWLLMAALPVQGMAAVVNAACAAETPAAHVEDLQPAQSLHPATSEAMLVVMAQSGDDEHAHHHHLMAQGDDDSAHAAHAASTPAGHDGHSASHGHAGCSACASCCFGAAAPPPPGLTPTMTGHSESVAPSPSPLFVGFVPPALERPPRHLAA